MADDIESQLKKYFAGEANPEEERKVLLWLASIKDEHLVKRMMQSDWEDILKGEAVMMSDSTKIWNAIQQKLHAEESLLIPKEELEQDERRGFIFSNLFKVAALLVLFIGVAYMIFSQRDKDKEQVLITKVAPANSPIRFVLPDGSTIYLNKGSKLTFYKDLTPREVTLEGEGFFEVKRDPASPFQVQIADLTIKVLGTRFNVSSYTTGPNIEVHLTEGSVSLQENDQEHILKPGERAVYNKQTSEVKIEEADADSAIAWTGRKLIFKNDPLPVVLKKLEKRYSISTRIVGAVDRNCLFNAVIENDSLSTVLELIKISSRSTYTLRGDSVIVYPGRCK